MGAQAVPRRPHEGVSQIDIIPLFGHSSGQKVVLAIGISGSTGRFPGMARKLRVEYPGAIYHPLALPVIRSRTAEGG